jgi:hypothetical protein
MGRVLIISMSSDDPSLFPSTGNRRCRNSLYKKQGAILAFTSKVIVLMRFIQIGRAHV